MQSCDLSHFSYPNAWRNKVYTAFIRASRQLQGITRIDGDAISVPTTSAQHWSTTNNPKEGTIRNAHHLMPKFSDIKLKWFHISLISLWEISGVSKPQHFFRLYYLHSQPVINPWPFRTKIAPWSGYGNMRSQVNLWAWTSRQYPATWIQD